MTERLQMVETIRPSDLSKETKSCFSVSGFVIGPVEVNPTKETRLWCHWPYNDHSKGCPFNTLAKPLCPGGSQTIYYDNAYEKEAYFVGISADFGAYLTGRKLNSVPDLSDVEIKNKRWYQSTLEKLLRGFVVKLYQEFPSLTYNGYTHILINAEAAGVNFSQVCNNANVAVVRLFTANQKRSFSSSPLLSLEHLGTIQKLTVVENYYAPSVKEVLKYYSSGGKLPMSRLALLVKSKN